MNTQHATISPDDTTGMPFIIELPEGVRRLNLMVENVHCAGCIRKIEGAMRETPGVVSARVNLSTRRLVVDWRNSEADAQSFVEKLDSLGFPAAPFDPGMVGDIGDKEEKRLLRALAVAGFAAANVMLLSVSVWSGSDGDMGEATRSLFHWISALIAMPCVAYSGQPFFRSAAKALANRSLNMDVPISLAVVLSLGMSLYQTIQGGEHAYFDASVTLLFFLLIGRYLDLRARAKARSAAQHLLSLSSGSASVINSDGSHSRIALKEITPGMRVAVASGERIPVDGTINAGETEVDTALVTGESLPRQVVEGEKVYAGTLNIARPVEILVVAAGEGTLLAEIVRLMEASEQGRAKYVRLADRVAAIYAPAVHIVSVGTFLGWFFIAGAGWEVSLMAAIAVLIITCPCALGLAVPAVQVVASGRLLSHGVLLKAPDGLERLGVVDTVVFDKTGTLTRGQLDLINREALNCDDLALAAALAKHSRHPLSRAIVREAPQSTPPVLKDVEEVPGFGMSAIFDGKSVRLGKASWCDVEEHKLNDGNEIELWLACEGLEPVRFAFRDTLRADAEETIAALRSMGIESILLSGDRAESVREVAETLGIEKYQSECLPDMKVAYLKDLADQGRKVVMVGDGLNDAPALAAGFASMSPSSASDISQTAADIIFQGDSLIPVPATIRTSRQADKLIRLNFALSFGYNAIAVPLAVAGIVTPLFAAVAMSSSSIVVTLNSLRLRAMTWDVWKR